MSVQHVEPIRKRSAQACDTCRTLKSKVSAVATNPGQSFLTILQCDSKRPSCSRCIGYGYACTYTNKHKRRRKYELPTATDVVAVNTSASTTTNPLDDYDDLVNRLRGALPETKQRNFDESFALVRSHLQTVINKGQGSDASPFNSQLQESLQQPTQSSQCTIDRIKSQRYLGEVSDVRFFNFITQRVLQDGDNPTDGLYSYEQEDMAIPIPIKDVTIDIPSLQLADTYIEIYFSTIHIAYPFVSKCAMTRMNRHIRTEGITKDTDVSALGLFCT